MVPHVPGDNQRLTLHRPDTMLRWIAAFHLGFRSSSNDVDNAGLEGGIPKSATTKQSTKEF